MQHRLECGYATVLVHLGAPHAADGQCLPAHRHELRLDSLDISTFLFTSDVGNATANLATTLTNQLRSVDPGNNVDAIMFAGDVYDEETYISVNWVWLIFPMAETLLVVILLGKSMVLTSEQPLLKTSLIALLVHGLDGWTKEDVAISGREDAEKLEHLAEHMNARLVDDGDGGLRFTRV